MEEFIPYIIVCPLVFVAGFIDAIAGGGGLISLPAYLMAGLPPHTAVGTNKFSSTIGTTVATYQYARQGFIHLKQAIPAIICSLSGAFLGARLALFVPENVFKIVLMVALPLIALYVLNRKSLTDNKPPHSLTKTLAIVSILAFFIGMYDGFYGPGTGTFLMLALTGWAHVSITDAAGITKTINLTSNITAFVVFLMGGVMWIELGAIAALFSIAGNYLGAHFFTKKGADIARPTIIFVLCLFFAKVCYDML